MNMSTFSPATVTSLGVANFMVKNRVAPQAVPRRDENVKLFTRNSDVTGHCQPSGGKSVAPQAVPERSPGEAKMSNFSAATMTSLGIASLMRKTGVAPQAISRRSEQDKLFSCDSDAIGHCQYTERSRRRCSGSPQETRKS